MARILISYRRETGWALAGRLYDNLVDKFGEENIFIDIKDIDPGANFVQILETTLASVDAVIPVIDRNWINLSDALGNRKLDAPDDFVRLEIATALGRDILVVPILEPGAKMPSAKELPQDLQALSRRNAIEVSQKYFRADVESMIELLETLRKDLDLSYLGVHAATAAKMLTDESERDRWERNYHISDTIWAPAFGGPLGWHTMREPILELLKRMDFSTDPKLEKAREQLIGLIQKAPLAEGRLNDDKFDLVHDLLQTSDITLLLEEIREAISIRGKFAWETAKVARIKAYKKAGVSEEEVEQWRQNWKILQAVYIPETLSQLPFGRSFTRREPLLDLLNRIKFPVDPELNKKQKELIALIQAAPIEDFFDRQIRLDLRLTPEMQLLRDDIMRVVTERDEAVKDRH